MKDTATLAGFIAAHAIWSIADGETLVPILAFTKSDHTREMTRLEGSDLTAAVQDGRRWLAGNPDQVQRAVLVYDGYASAQSGQKTDALIIETRTYGETPGEFTMTLPYRSPRHHLGLAIYRPAFVVLADGDQLKSLSDAFFKGVNQHREAAPVWKKHFDPSR
jgi:hypothetical protein